MLYAVGLGFMTQDIGRTFGILTISNMCSVIAIRLVVQNWLWDTCMRKFQHNRKYILLNQMVEENPWHASPVVWGFMIPYGIKSIFLS
jgi:uncharacterized membrane protein YdjX (TVP38/TMEM64 family)